MKVDETVALKNFDKPAINLAQAVILMLPGSSVVYLPEKYYELIVQDKLDNDETELMSTAAGLKRNEPIQFGYVDIEKESKDCNFIHLKRYFNSYKTYSFHADLETDSKCTSYTFESKLFNGDTASVAYFNQFYASEKNSELADLEDVSFNSKGETDVKLPRGSFLALSFKYQPPDIKDIL